MIYSNNNGTTSTSFKIGPRGIELSSSAVIEDRTNVLKGFKRLTTSYNGQTRAVAYDIEIPDRFVVDCSVDPNNDNIYNLTILNRHTGVSQVVSINAGLGHTGVGFSGDSAVKDNIATYADDTGRNIKDSGFSVYTGDLGNGSDSLTAEVPTVSSVYNYVGELTDYLANRLNGERLEGNNN